MRMKVSYAFYSVSIEKSKEYLAVVLPVKGASVVVVHYDGENYFERFLNTDQNGKIFFSTAKKGVYMAVTRKPLAEGIEGIYDSKEIASTFTYVKR